MPYSTGWTLSTPELADRVEEVFLDEHSEGETKDKIASNEDHDEIEMDLESE
jgi:hypothetical protein